MLSKKFRLRTRDVRFLTHKRNYFSSGFFWFFYISQYDNLKFNQISCHVSLKFSKRATDRNVIKRIIYNYLLDKKMPLYIFWNKYYKFFVVLQKSKIDDFKKQIENLEQKDIVLFVNKCIWKSVSDLVSCLSK